MAKPGENKPNPSASTRKLKIPPILLEGDNPPPATTAPKKAAGSGIRYTLGEAPPAERRDLPAARAKVPADLPESYGTGKLFLAARDPHWLYCAWDFSPEHQRELNRESRDGHLVLRMFAETAGAAPLPEVHVHPESRTWFLYVPQGGTRYRAELGYYNRKGAWHSVSSSLHTFTPPDAPSADLTVEFATIPARVTFQELVATVEEYITENRPLLEAIVAANADQENFPRENFALPAKVETGEPWPAHRVQQISRLVTMDTERRVWIGSLEITELIRRRLQDDTSSIAAAELARGAVVSPAVPGAAGISSISSPFGGVSGRERKFWFNINAELIIYGATEPDASVQIGGRSIQLRADGSFSFRFALPDGRYELPVTATSNDREETKAARLQFMRATDYLGDVPPHPQDSKLKKPSPENVS